MRVAKGGGYWILSSVIITVVFLVSSVVTSGLSLDLSLTFFIFFCIVSSLLLIFFRDPERLIGAGIIAVADGKIQEITHLHDSEIGECIRISTFMNIHNVHVNRMPLDGTIMRLTYQTGGHWPAFQKESERNERVIILIQTSIGVVKVVQIAGAVARRIVPYVQQGDTLEKGARLGLIRLGSRVDVYLPTKKIKPLSIHVNDRKKAGEDTIAEPDD